MPFALGGPRKDSLCSGETETDLNSACRRALSFFFLINDCPLSFPSVTDQAIATYCEVIAANKMRVFHRLKAGSGA